MEVIGYIGSILIQLHSIPQAVQCYKQKHADGFSHAFLFMWTVGCGFMLVYTVPMLKAPLILNYALNTFTGAYIWYYKFKGDK